MRGLVLTLVLLCLLGLGVQGKIRQLTEKNLEQFAKDNSYWLIQITSSTVER